MLNYICGSTIHEIMVMTTLNFILNLATLCILILRKPIHVVDNRVDLK
jgi:hypothetical protein